MKILGFILSLFLFVSCQIYAGVTEIRDASITAIPTTYSASGGTLMSGVLGNNICCQNIDVSASVDLCFSEINADDCGVDWVIPEGTGVCFENDGFSDNVYMRATAGAVNSGVLQCRKWIRN